MRYDRKITFIVSKMSCGTGLNILVLKTIWYIYTITLRKCIGKYYAEIHIAQLYKDKLIHIL